MVNLTQGTYIRLQMHIYGAIKDFPCLVKDIVITQTKVILYIQELFFDLMRGKPRPSGQGQERWRRSRP
ncbi:MAG: hypothetical protein HZB76_01195 [Chlamydiae bacterium]|nr:hypothetical protein [Chlamydiota bacterium]